MNNNTNVKPTDTTEIKAKLLQDIIDQALLESAARNPNDTSCHPGGNSQGCVDLSYGYNRKVRRYAEQHNITLEKAFKILYK